MGTVLGPMQLCPQSRVVLRTIFRYRAQQEKTAFAPTSVQGECRTNEEDLRFPKQQTPWVHSPGPASPIPGAVCAPKVSPTQQGTRHTKCAESLAVRW
jgi:hypothetical protein